MAKGEKKCFGQTEDFKKIPFVESMNAVEYGHFKSQELAIIKEHLTNQLTKLGYEVIWTSTGKKRGFRHVLAVERKTEKPQPTKKVASKTRPTPTSKVTEIPANETLTGSQISYAESWLRQNVNGEKQKRNQ